MNNIFNVSIIDHKEIAKDILELSLNMEGTDFVFKSGQFIELKLPYVLHGDAKGNSRFFSIVSSPLDKKVLTLAFRLSKSPFKQMIAKIPLGTKVEIAGPLGSLGLELAKDFSQMVFVAGGLGITPFMSMVRFWKEQQLDKKITLIYGNRDRESVAYFDELKELVKNYPNFTMREKYGPIDKEFIKQSVPNFKEVFWYIVGPPVMVTSIKKELLGKGVGSESMAFEEYPEYEKAQTKDGKDKLQAVPLIRQAEEVLNDPQRLASIVATSLDGIFITDSEGVFLYVNTAWERLSGWSAGEVVGQVTPRILNSGLKSSDHYTNLWDTIKRGETYRSEVTDKRKDGTLFTADQIIVPFKNTADQIIGFTSFQRDITARKAAEEQLEHHTQALEKVNSSLSDTQKAMLNILEDAKDLEEQLRVEKAGVEKKVAERTTQLKEEQARLEASINSLNIGFIMTDTNCEIITMNSVAGRILCFPQSKSGVLGALHEPLRLECTMNDIEKNLEGSFDIKANLHACLKEQKSIDEKEVIFGDRYLHIFLAPIVVLDEVLKVIGVVILIEDITEAKILERSRDEFFSIASHELRTPLTAIRGNTSLIQQFYAEKLKNDKELNEMIEDIHESSTRLIAIVNDFLDTSRLELGKMQFNNGLVDLSSLSQDVVKEYITTGSMKNLYLKLENPDTKYPLVYADKDRVKQILINLVGNALKFTEKGGITIQIKPEGKYLKVLIIDTGRGIPEENQKLLFRKFQQAGNSIYTRDAIHGTGLGLYICKLMAEAMGGSITLEKTEEGKGSTFSVTLPLATEKQQKEAVTLPTTGALTAGTQATVASQVKSQDEAKEGVVSDQVSAQADQIEGSKMHHQPEDTGASGLEK